YPRKGSIAVGADADLVVFDPERRETISAAAHHSKCDYNLYESTEIVGAPEPVLLRGSGLVEDGELVGTPRTARFLPPGRVLGRPAVRGGGRGRASRSKRAPPCPPSRGFFTAREQKLLYPHASRGVLHRSATRAAGTARGFGHRANRAPLDERI